MIDDALSKAVDFAAEYKWIIGGFLIIGFIYAVVKIIQAVK